MAVLPVELYVVPPLTVLILKLALNDETLAAKELLPSVTENINGLLKLPGAIHADKVNGGDTTCRFL
jgi:hypothetical protein